MHASGWRLWAVRTLIKLDRDLNKLSHAVLMPQGTRLGSGKDETFCAHWHTLETQGVLWAKGACWLLDKIDCEHCKKSHDEYRGKGQWLLGKR
jgi:hypothetical protein